MTKPKYEKPVANDLSSIQTAHGSCVSGGGEQNLGACEASGTGAAACLSSGLAVLGQIRCQPSGSSAAFGCWNGSLAG